MFEWDSFQGYTILVLAGAVIIIPLIVYISMAIKLMSLRKEKDNYITKLRDQLQLKLEIDGEAEQRRKAQIEELKKENENLRIRVQEYRQKPRRDVVRQLHVYDKAIGIMQERAPGIASVWQSSLREAEAEMEASEKGLVSFAKRALLPGATASGESHAAHGKDDDDEADTDEVQSRASVR